jgi:osmotically-inducible protein OsmY
MTRLLPFFLVVLLIAAPVFADKRPVTDDSIYDQILLKLAGDREVGGAGITVEIHNGAVTLKGKVQHDKQKAKAERLTKKVKGVTSVNNQLVVGEK